MLRIKYRGTSGSRFGRGVSAAISVVFLLLLAACGSSTQTPPQEIPTSLPALATSAPTAVPDAAEAEEGYPPAFVQPEPTVVEGPYPPPRPTRSPVPESYPAETEDEFQEPRFRLDGPLTAGATTITGQAPAGMNLAIVDVTFNGELLGTGAVEADNSFSIDVTALQEGHLIGVTFGELEQGLDIGEMSIKYFPHRGDGFLNLPNVGIMLDSAQVQP